MGVCAAGAIRTGVKVVQKARFKFPECGFLNPFQRSAAILPAPDGAGHCLRSCQDQAGPSISWN